MLASAASSIALVLLTFSDATPTPLPADGTCSAGDSKCHASRANSDPDDPLNMLQVKSEISNLDSAYPRRSSSPQDRRSTDAPEMEDDGNQRSAEIKTLEKVLLEAAGIADHGEAQDIMQARDVLEEDRVKRSDASEEDVAKKRSTILDAIELLESKGNISVEAAAAEDALVTADLLEMVTGVEGPEEEDSGTENMVEGDMMTAGSEDQASLVEASQAGRRWYGALWKKGAPIPYCFAPKTPASVKKAFRDATAHIMFKMMLGTSVWNPNDLCLRFKEVAWKKGEASSASDRYKHQKCSESPAIFVQSHKDMGCNSYIGMMSNDWSTTLQLKKGGCDTMGIAAHEIGHALGMAHEHSRPDRKGFVKVLWQNIKARRREAAKNFKTASNADTSVPYDYLSLMHYSATSFGKDGGKHRRRRNKLKTITTKTTGDPVGIMGHFIGQRQGLSDPDVTQITKMYCQ